ncbi:sialin-like [Venturia canescens]|uniref:sialin-like n=1 Tax=Venturia canescens TaxID=32260 RepID=UPI001C9D44A3|nr:sialin-like [Venturia canescens]
MYKQYFEKFCPQWIPARVVICIMMFTACWVSYMCRLQMAILAVPMIKTGADAKQSSGACIDSPSEDDRPKRWLVLDPLDDLSSSYDFEADFQNSSHSIVSRSTNETGGRLPAMKGNETLGERMSNVRLFTGEPFEWSAFTRGQLISAYGWGNVPGNLVGGLLAQKYGPRQSVFWSSLLAAIISLLTPLIAQIHWMALAASRVIIGFTGGITFPSCHTLVARWAPPTEKGRFVWTLQGGTFGSIFLFGIISSIAENINWEAGWYFPALVTIVWTGFWFLLTFDSPEEHPRISDAEKEYILSSQAGVVRKEKPSLKTTPIREILTSIPFLCLTLCHFGNVFLLFFYQSGMMLYQTKALGFKLTKGGVVSGLPWASRVIFSFFFGWAGDTIQKRKLMSVTTLRKSATIFSHLLPGLCLIIVGYLGCAFIWANVFLVLALGLNGAASISNLSNNQDLSPNYAGFLYGLMNTLGCLSGIIVPPVIEEVAGKWGNPIEKWRILFWIGAAVCICCMLIFIVGGSGKVQSWNEIKVDDSQQASEQGASQQSKQAAKT